MFISTIYLALFVTDRCGWLGIRNGIWLVSLVICLSPLVVGGGSMILKSLRKRLASVHLRHSEGPADSPQVDRKANEVSHAPKVRDTLARDLNAGSRG